MDPHRGALLRVVHDGVTMSRITAAYAVANDLATSDHDMIFIVPRREDRLVGGLVKPGAHSTDLHIDDQPIRDMLARCVEFLPALRQARLDRTDPLRDGLCAFRADGVWLETEPRHPHRAQLSPRRRRRDTVLGLRARGCRPRPNRRPTQTAA